MIIKINPENPQQRLIRKVADALNEGGVIAYPTDTIYGVGCNLYQKDAIKRIHQLKRHNKNKRLSIICADLKDTRPWSLYLYLGGHQAGSQDHADKPEDGGDQGPRQYNFPGSGEGAGTSYYYHQCDQAR